MKFRFSIPVLVAALALSGAGAFQTQAQAQSSSTTFHCVKSGSGWATVARRGSKQSPPMISWERYISAEYTPEQRCQTVSQKLTRAVAENGGSLKNLLLTSGRVGRETVICYVNRGDRCGSNNTLFTLTNPESIRDPGSVLAKLLRFGQGSATAGRIRENLSGGEEQTGASVNEVDMEEAVNTAFRESIGGEEVSPNPENSTDNNPSPVVDPGTNNDSGGF